MVRKKTRIWMTRDSGKTHWLEIWFLKPEWNAERHEFVEPAGCYNEFNHPDGRFDSACMTTVKHLMNVTLKAGEILELEITPLRLVKPKLPKPQK